jgi:separase
MTTIQEQTKLNYLISNAYLVYSMLALRRGASQTALTHAKQSVRLLRRAWTNTEEQLRRKSTATTDNQCQTETEKLTEEVSHLRMSTITVPVKAMTQQSLPGSGFWALVVPMFRGLFYLSGLYAHHGMFQETIYYADQAYKLAKEIGSEAHLAMASALLGSTWLKAGALDKGSEFLMSAKELSASCVKRREAAIIAYHLGSMHGLLGDRASEVAAYQDAEQTLKIITGSDFINTLDRIVDPSDVLEEQMSQLTIAKVKVTISRKATTRSKGPVKRKAAAARAQSPVDVTTSVAEECPELMSLRAMLLRQKARALTLMKKCVEAVGLLNEADGYTSNQIDMVDQGLAIAKQLLVQSMEQMNADPVYSVLPESTISFPSVVGVSKSDRSSGDRLSVARMSPPRKTRATKTNRDRAGSKSPAPDCFFDKLRQAQEHLIEVHLIAVLIAPVSVIHKTCTLLNSVAILLSAAGQVKGKSLAHPGFASCTIGRHLTLRSLSI